MEKYIKQVNRVFVTNVAAPTAGQTIVLFASHPRQPGGSGTAVQSTYDGGVIVDSRAIELLEAVFSLHDQASAANGLRFYVTNDGGATWAESDLKDGSDQPTIGAAAPVQVPALSSGQEWTESIEVGRYRGFALEYTGGSTPPTAWAVTVSAKCTEASAN